MSQITISDLSSDQQLIAFGTLIKAGLQEAYDLTDKDEKAFYDSIVYSKIARCVMPEDFARKMPEFYKPDGGLISPLFAGKLPRSYLLAQLMPLGFMEAVSINGGGSTSWPLLREAQEINMGPYEQKTHVSRWIFESDIYGTLSAWVRMLRRASEKNADLLLARLLNLGESSACWHTGATGKNFFGTAIPCDLATGLSGDVFDNYFTGMPLTAANVLRQIGYSKTIKLGDGFPGGINLDTLIYPPELTLDAETAALLQYIVWSGTGGVGNLAPGQANGTAAMGQNAVQVMRHVKQIIPMDMLTARQAFGTGAGPGSTWYLMDSRCFSLGYARALGPSYAWQISPNDTAVFEENEYRSKVNTWEGTGYLLPQYIQKNRGI